jgi:hypothetical protein
VRRRVGIAALVVAGALFVPAVPAGAKTTVRVKGDVVTITVPVDCVGCKDWVDPVNGGNLADYWEKTAEKMWNDAFDKYSYCNKYKFKLDIVMKNRPAGSASRFGTHELIATQPDGRGFTGAGWGGAPESTPGGPEGQRSADGSRYYEFDGQGTMPADATPTVIVHEFGHVIGLGDDRDAAGNAVGSDPHGIMVGGATGITPNTKLKIGKNHVDRIGDQLANLGKVTCGQVWKGTIQGSVSAPACSPSSVPVNGELSLNVQKNGDVRGRGGWTEDAFSCGGAEVAAMTLAFPITGRKDGDRFTLQLEGPAGLLQMDAQGGRASGTVDNPGAGGYGSTLTFTVDRQDTKDAVG